MTARKAVRITLAALAVVWAVVVALAVWWGTQEPEDLGFFIVLALVIGLVLSAIVGGCGAVVWATLRKGEGR